MLTILQRKRLILKVNFNMIDRTEQVLIVLPKIWLDFRHFLKYKNKRLGNKKKEFKGRRNEKSILEWVPPQLEEWP